MVRAAVRVPGAVARRVVAALEQLVAGAARAAVRVPRANVRGRHTAANRFVAHVRGGAVHVGPALHAQLKGDLTVRSRTGAVGVALADHTLLVRAADFPGGAVKVVRARDAPAGLKIANGRLAAALRRVHALHAAVAGDVAPQAIAVSVRATRHACLRIGVTHPRRAVVVDDALNAAIVLAVAAQTRRAVLGPQACAADPVRTAATPGAVRIRQAADAGACRRVAAPAWAVGVRQAGDAAGRRVATGPGAVGVLDARRTPPLGDQTATLGALSIRHTLDADALRVADATRWTVTVARTLHARLVPAAPPGAAVRVDCAAHAAALGDLAARRAAAVGVLEAVDAPPGVAGAGGAVTSVDALDAFARHGIAAQPRRTIRVIGAGDTPHRSGIAACPRGAVGINGAPDAGCGPGVTDAVGAVGVAYALDAATRRDIARATAQTVAVARALHADMGGRVADRAGGAVLTPAALHTASLARQAHADVAVRVREALHTHARAQITQAPRALRVGRALDAATPRQVAHAGSALVVRQALDTDAPQRVTACAFPALGVRDTLPT